MTPSPFDALMALSAEFGLDEALLRHARSIRNADVRVDEPTHFGLFNPAPMSSAVMARALAAALGSQLAVRPFAKIASRIEDAAVSTWLDHLGLGPEAAGHFCGGGSEAIQSAVLSALQSSDPGFRDRGVADRRPRIYRSASGHRALDKAVRASGLGQSAVVSVPCDAKDRLDPSKLRAFVQADRAAGRKPLMIVGTAGTTGTGAVDPLTDLAEIARAEELWFHVDAAWAGAGILSEAKRQHLAGIEGADSVNIDMHKWVATPQSVALLALRSERALVELMAEDEVDYLPGAAAKGRDLRERSLSWSRPLRGLEVLAAMREGEGLERRLDRMCDLGSFMADRLEDAGWQLWGRGPFPVLCFRDREDQVSASEMVRALWRRGGAWISQVTIGDGQWLRAAVTNHRSQKADVVQLITVLDEIRCQLK